VERRLSGFGGGEVRDLDLLVDSATTARLEKFAFDEEMRG